MSVAEMKLVIVIAKMIGADATCCVVCTSTSFGGMQAYAILSVHEFCSTDLFKKLIHEIVSYVFLTN
jgi:hypothetical protein